MPIRAVLFDLDGVLIDSDEAIARAWTKIYSRHEWEIPSKDEILKGSGRTDEQWAAFLFPDKPQEETKVLAREFQESFSRFFFPILAKIEPQAIPLLTELKKHYKLALVSNANVGYAEKHAKSLGLTEFFEVIATDADGQPKPSPERLLSAAKKLGVSPSECAYIGDTETDILAAKAAGMPSVLVFHSRNKSVTGADYHAQSLDEIVKIVKTAP